MPGKEGEASRFSLDHLFIDQDGIPTLVEVKRSTDTRCGASCLSLRSDERRRPGRFKTAAGQDVVGALGCRQWS